jgi:hypothetical protein
MHDNLNPSGSARDGRDGKKAGTSKPRDHEIRPVVEREVPLGQQAERALASSVHAWLDGELPEAAVRKGETAHDVEFWRGLTDQMDRARRMRTPAHIESQIMAALPHHPPAAMITPWYRREFVITPVAAVTTTAAIMALTALVTVAFIAP